MLASAERASAEIFFAFSHSKTTNSFNIILLVFLILYLRNIYLFRSQITSAYIYNQCSSLLLLMVWRYADKILTLRKIYLYASELKSLEKFRIFTF